MTTISIITVCYNSEKYILDTIKSVNDQTYPHIEHVFIDGRSDDNTCKIITENSKRKYKLISENDNGIYDAMNKGYRNSSGDVFAYLNSDDVYDSNDTLKHVMEKFESKTNVVYGDIYFVQGSSMKRYWHTGQVPNSWQSGFQIPHPALFMRRRLFTDEHDIFDPKYKIAGDLKLQLSVFKKYIVNHTYLEEALVRMRLGGASTRNLQAVIDGFIETRSAYNDVHCNGGLRYAVRKLLSKLRQKNTKRYPTQFKGKTHV